MLLNPPGRHPENCGHGARQNWVAYIWAYGIVGGGFMSEFKFACPVCGQHITVDSSASGTQLDCPTCFRKIIVPQAPATGETKLILSAAQVSKPRPSPFQTSNARRVRRSTLWAWLPTVGLVLVLGACGVGFYLWRDKVFQQSSQQTQVASNEALQPAAFAPRVVHPIPTNTSWTLNLTNAVIPDTKAAGSIQGRGFLCERATLQGGNLTLRQGRGGSAEATVGIALTARSGEELSGKTIEILPSRVPPVPRITVRWKDDQDQTISERYAAGYALRIVFGQALSNRMPARIYLALPDEAKSFVAGTFRAEIRKPQPPKSTAPRPAAGPTVAR